MPYRTCIKLLTSNFLGSVVSGQLAQRVYDATDLIHLTYHDVQRPSFLVTRRKWPTRQTRIFVIFHINSFLFNRCYIVYILKMLNSDFLGTRRKWPTRQMGIRHYRSNTLDMSRRPSAELMPPASHRGCFPARWACAAAQNTTFFFFLLTPKNCQKRPHKSAK